MGKEGICIASFLMLLQLKRRPAAMLMRRLCFSVGYTL